MTGAPGFEDGSVEIDLSSEPPPKVEEPRQREQSGTDAAFVKPAPAATPEPKRPVAAKASEFEENWSERVQKRFGQLRAKQGEAERAAATERTARIEAERVAAAEAADKKSAIERLIQYDRALTTERGVSLAQWERANKAERGRVEIELREANSANAAGEDGAAQRLAQAQSDIARLSAEESRLLEEKAKYKPVADEPVRETRQPAKEPVREQQQSTLLPKAKAWIDANPRFGTDPEFADAARVIARQLIKSNVPADADEHYVQLDKRLKAVLAEEEDDVELDELLNGRPEARQDGGEDLLEEAPPVRQQERRPPVAAPTRPAVSTRQSGNNPRLSKEEVDLARSLNMPLRKYYDEKMKLQAGSATDARLRPMSRERW